MSNAALKLKRVIENVFCKTEVLQMPSAVEVNLFQGGFWISLKNLEFFEHIGFWK